MSVDGKFIYRGEKPFIVMKWKVKPGNRIFPSTVILTYVYPNEKSELKLKADVEGTVRTLLVEERELVQPGSALLQLQSCTHEVIMKELCAQCGADLRQLSRQNLEEVVASRSFSMVHIVPELKCSLEQAKQLDEADKTRLLEAKKLVLLVDLDQTLIHTTNEDVPTDIKDVYHFQLYGASSPWYHTRLRPNTRLFLEKISKLYELHIFTFGARMYAHKVASILDPDGKLFSHRILSRDECFDATSKTGNLKSLFPRGDDMVCIIDDREDVWNYAPNVVHVKPYVYFNNTGDINAPPTSTSLSEGCETSSYQKHTGIQSESLETQSKNKMEVTDDMTTLQTICTEDTKKTGGTNSEGENGNSNSDLQAFMDGQSSKNCDSNSVPHNVITKEHANKKMKNQNSDLRNVPCKSGDNDNDDYLLYLEEILNTIHKAYFDIYDEMKGQVSTSIPDLKNVIPYVRRKVLRGTNIVFSGVIPTNMAPEKSSLWVLAKSLGASVSTNLVFDDDKKNRTTHIIASKVGTAKLSKARRVGGVHIVTPSWLICCATRWERADERLFPLKKTTVPPPLPKKYKKHLKCQEGNLNADNSVGGRNLIKRKKLDERYEPKCTAVLDFSLEEIETMGKEVTEACESSGNSSSGDDSLPSLPSLRKKRQKKLNDGINCESQAVLDEKKLQEFSCNSENSCEQLNENSGDTISNSSSISSDDEELAAAVEQKLLNFIPNADI